MFVVLFTLSIGSYLITSITTIIGLDSAPFPGNSISFSSLHLCEGVKHALHCGTMVKLCHSLDVCRSQG